MDARLHIFRHGLGDAVMFTPVLRHLVKYQPETANDVAVLKGKHSAFSGLARTCFIDDVPGTAGYQQVVRHDWPDCGESWPDSPGTKAAKCLRDVFGLVPEWDLLTYSVPVGDAATARADQYVRTLPDRPFVLIHYQGNTATERKNLSHDTAREVCDWLLGRGLTPVILDWDRRSPLPNQKTIFNPGVGDPLWMGYGTGDAETIAALTARAALFVGIDSGPCKVAYATTTPTLTVWVGLHPYHYCDRAENAVHLVPDYHEGFLHGNRNHALAFFEANYEYEVYAHGHAAGHITQKAASLLGLLPNPMATPELVPARAAQTDYYEQHKVASLDKPRHSVQQEEYPPAVGCSDTGSCGRIRMKGELVFNWPHGLGDTALFAPALNLWTTRGYKVRVLCSADKACLFEAAGVTVGGGTMGVPDHGYFCPPAPGRPELHDHWSGNKLAWNLNQKPLPDIGGYADLWSEYESAKCSLKLQLPEQAQVEVDEFLATIGGPVVLIHPRGNTSPREKNFPEHLEGAAIREILDRTGATVLILDWDDRVSRVASRRVRHLTDDFRRLTVPELWYTIEQAACLVGVDSGPLHLATKWTSTPTIGVWTGHHPAHFAATARHVAHLVTGGPHDANRVNWNRHRRHSFNVIDVGAQHTGAGIANTVARVLAGKVGRELVIEHLLEMARCLGSGETYQDRDQTFRLALSHLRSKLNPRVVETGCIRCEDDWTAGYSSYLFGLFLQGHGGHLDSVDFSPTNVAFARRWTASFGDAVAIHESDSVAWLRSYSGPSIDVAYLDSLDADQPGHAEHGLAEAKAVLPHLTEDALILIDDSGWRRGAWYGKGQVAIPWLLKHGFHLLYSGYQTLLKRGTK